MGDDHAVTEECMDVGEEGRGLRVRVRRREQPTAEEVREHNVLHHPYRSWCPWCVGARAPDRQHREAKNPEDSRLRSEVALDYAFLRDTAKGPSATLLAGKDRRTGTFIGHIVPLKGAGLTWVVEQLIRDFRRLGYYGELTLRGVKNQRFVIYSKQLLNIVRQLIRWWNILPPTTAVRTAS